MLCHGENELRREVVPSWLHRIHLFAELSHLDGQLDQPCVVSNEALNALMAFPLALPLDGCVKGLHLVLIQ